VGQAPHGLPVPHTDVHRIFQRALEWTQDLLVLGLGVALFALMLRTLAGMFADLLRPAIDVRSVIAEVLFILVMVELVRLLVVYLREHRVAVDFMVELGIVSTLREVVLRGVTEVQPLELLAIAAFLLVLGVLLRFSGLRALSGEGPPTGADSAASGMVRRPVVRGNDERVEHATA
jgi:uncharacterized membrane protein (DUF373 family)